MLVISLVCGKILTNGLSGRLKMKTLTTAEETTIKKIINHLVKVCPEQLVSLNIYEDTVFKNLVEMNAPFARNVMNEGKILSTN